MPGPAGPRAAYGAAVRGSRHARRALTVAPDRAFVSAGVGPQAPARRIEDHHGVAVVKGRPAGITAAGETDPRGVHLLG